MVLQGSANESCCRDAENFSKPLIGIQDRAGGIECGGAVMNRLYQDSVGLLRAVGPDGRVTFGCRRGGSVDSAAPDLVMDNFVGLASVARHSLHPAGIRRNPYDRFNFVRRVQALLVYTYFAQVGISTIL